MAESFFRQGVLKRAWSLTWTHKSLWFFGLFAAILAIGEEYDLLLRNVDILDSVQRRLDQWRIIAQQGLATPFINDLGTFLRTNVLGSATIALTWLLSILALAWLIIVSQSALIEGARRHENGKSLNLLEGFDVGMANFWPVFLLNVIAKVFVYGALLIVIVPLGLAYIKTGNHTVAVITALWTFVVLFPIIAVVAFVTRFAGAYIVIKRFPVRQAIAAAISLFRRHWLVTLELALILMVISFLAIYTVVATLMVASGFPNLSTGGYLTFLVLLGFLFAWLTTFKFAAWTHLFLRLEEGNAPSKLRRIIHYVLGVHSELPSKPVITRAGR
ncbi:MAG: hypothetical protein HY420_02490 [Candidatus Kerfeldbacteria bacterium]|nr:hypothetical protein [Candidatus Kerfeldbacteria bacterium]